MKRNNSENLSDEQLAGKIVSESLPDLFEILYSRYFRKVREKCFTLLKNRMLADEFAEDILSKAFEKLDSFKGNSSFSSWLYAITYNQCIDHLRLKAKLHYPKWNIDHEIPEIIDETEEDYVGLQSVRLSAVIEILHTEEKALILMKYQDGLSVRQISQALRLTEGAVKMRLKRAKARLLYLFVKQYGSYV
jgi:RNA polymerase sigma factor (sigma-70 family)